jgi:hypothetical protein
MNKTIKTVKTFQKPIDFNVVLQYRCPNCENDYWITYLQASTKNFKMVCDCGTIFKPKRITDLKLKFEKRIKNVNQQSSPNTTIPNDLLNNCVNVLVGYGFDKKEAQDLISSAFNKSPSDSVSSLVKQALESMRREHG